MDTEQSILTLQSTLNGIDELAFAILIGSQATGKASPASDWDIAIRWNDDTVQVWQALARNETLRRTLAGTLGIDESRVDIIDLQRASLTMRTAVAEEGYPLSGEDDLPWMRFLTRTWRDLEHWYLEREYAA